MKCYVCKSGNLSITGCHEYCDNCNFSRFVITEGYIDSCVYVLSELVSNKTFVDDSALYRFVGENIPVHTPKLLEIYQANGIMDTLIQEIKTQAINLHVGVEAYNEKTDKRKDLVCQCQCSEFSPGPLYPKEILCKSCQAKYIHDETTGMYEPEFLCECGCVTWQLIDDASGLSMCADCNAAYIHNHINNTFTRVTE